MLKRIVLFLITNLAILVVISIILSIFNFQPYLNKYGINYQALLIFALIFGFTGSLISLFLSKWMAIHAYSIQILKNPTTELESWLLNVVKKLAMQSQISMPDVGIYDSPEPNAFATGWNKNNAILAVSTSLLNQMTPDEIEAVLGHEVSHIGNGDMVTLALIQGVVNTFVIFFARVAAFFLTSFLRKEGSGDQQGGFVYYGVAMIFELLFGILASMIVLWFSRYREYRADAGSAKMLGKQKMIMALQRLQQITEKAPVDNRAPALNNMKINSPTKWTILFSSHPPIEERIAALKNQ